MSEGSRVGWGKLSTMGGRGLQGLDTYTSYEDLILADQNCRKSGVFDWTLVRSHFIYLFVISICIREMQQ